MKIRWIWALLAAAMLLSACGGKKAPETTAATEETVLQTEASVSVEALAAPEDPAPVNEPEAEGVPIDFRMIYRGFTAVSLDDTENYERFCGYGTKMIASEEEWSSFMAAYCPGRQKVKQVQHFCQRRPQQAISNQGIFWGGR